MVVPLTGQFVSRTASFSRDFRAIQRAPCLTYTEAWPGLTFFLASDEIAIGARDNASRQPTSQFNQASYGHHDERDDFSRSHGRAVPYALPFESYRRLRNSRLFHLMTNRGKMYVDTSASISFLQTRILPCTRAKNRI